MVGLHAGDGIMVWGRVSAFMGRLLMSIWKLQKRLRDKLVEGGYAADHIFNMAETGLFYRCMPRCSYLLDGCDSRQAGRGMKSLKAKDRVTLVLCLNATGSFKIPPLMIETAKKNPHCFRDSPPAIPYTHQCNVWLDREKYTNIGGITFYFHISISGLVTL